MLTPAQNQIVTLMFLSGILFLGLNFIARCLVFPAPRGSKRTGYLMFVIVLMAGVVTLQYRLLLGLEFSASWARNLLLGGLAVSAFLISLVFYRYRRNRSSSS